MDAAHATITTNAFHDPASKSFGNASGQSAQAGIADSTGLDSETARDVEGGLQDVVEDGGGSVNTESPKIGTSKSEDTSHAELQRWNTLAKDFRELQVEPAKMSSGPSTTTNSEDPPTEDSKPEIYLDPTPKTPRMSSPSRAHDSPVEAPEESGPTPEIQNIMDQFGDADGFEAKDGKIHTGRANGMTTDSSVQHPPRGSSLEPLIPGLDEAESLASPTDRPLTIPNSEESNTSELVMPTRVSSLPQNAGLQMTGTNASSTLSLPKALPPTPDPEPDLPFDFHRFLEQLRHRSADPVARYLRSFLTEFGKKQWMAHEQVKFIQDFLAFIANKMAQCEVWRGVSDAEFDNAREGMEKLVMNRLYSQTFSPAIAPTATSVGKGKKKDLEKLLGHGRRGQHQEDIERDDILSQKVSIYSWVQEEHLDIKSVGPSGKRLLDLAQQGLLRNSQSSDTSADAFVPLLIFVVLHANPEHLVSNVQYILRFRNQDKLGGEAGYYLSSLVSVDVE
ncbi:uncharacterized protein KY384_002209 [Bacidia gigantensis]|uniref:uncharacterized protein n=1 Tax=Bacidia gigantensis TaxID=2732470 RepID=UPI001D04C5B4|nr:uncharacterized protein KY384_002209 [Bacidia gigantensis]KAG8533426.1 hypothetical protein KY384_002209 [Bacidia gigantensis]